MAKTDYKTINEYHETWTPEIQDRLQTIRELIRSIAPEAEEVISYQIPAFKVGKKFLIYYAAFANHLTLSSPWSVGFLAKFENELKKYKTSKSVIQFPHNKELPLDFIKNIIEFRKTETYE